jgi:hypothetical protein
MNVLKLHLQTTILTLLAAGKSQREIARIPRVDRKIRIWSTGYSQRSFRGWTASTPAE